MKHTIELKMNTDDSGLLTNWDTTLYLDGNAIGCIQNINIVANVDTQAPILEIAFPDLTNTSSVLKDDIDYYISNLLKIPNIKIKMFSLEKTMVQECGTDGYIESVPEYEILP